MSSFVFKGDKQVVQDLTVKPDPSIGNLIKASLKSVEVIENKVEKVNADTGKQSEWEYAGYNVPQLRFTFVQVRKDGEVRDRYLKYSEEVLTFVTKEGAAVSNDTLGNLFEQMNDRIVHLHNTYIGLPNYKAIPEISFNEKGNAKERLASFKQFFTEIADAFNKGANGKPIYIDGKEHLVPCYIKVLPEYRSKAFYTLPTFVGKGFIERAGNVAPMIELTRGELANFELKSRGGSVSTTSATGDVPGYSVQDAIDPAVAAIIASQQQQ